MNRPRLHPIVTVLLSFVAACSSSPRPTNGEPFLPRPYTSDELHAEWTPGFEVTFRRWSVDTGESFEGMRVREAGPDGVVIDGFVIDAVSRRRTPAKGERVSWSELRDRHTYPSDRVTRDEVTIDTALGRLDCWRYRDADGEVVSDYLFAKRLPGPPVRIEVRRRGEPILEVEQIERRSAP